MRDKRKGITKTKSGNGEPIDDQLSKLEKLGRIYQRAPGEFTLGIIDLKKAHLYSLATTPDTKLINMVKLQAMLHLTADQTMGTDYSITQAITA